MQIEIKDEKILNVYMHSGHIYDASGIDEVEYLFVVDGWQKHSSIIDPYEKIFNGIYSVCVHDLTYFQHMLKRHHPFFLECVFLPDEFRIESHKPDVNINSQELCRSFCSEASTFWREAKQRLPGTKGAKSLFHSLRTLLFAIQIKEHGKIVDFTRASCHWRTICRQGFAEWSDYEEYWGPVYTNLYERLLGDL